MGAAQDTPSAGPRLTVNVGRPGPWQPVQVGGELDLATVPELFERISELIASRPEPFIALDMSGVTFCDSSGINTLIRLWKHAKAAGGDLVLMRPDPRVARLLKITAVDRHLRICDDVPDRTGPDVS
ncbi:hypothetical protein Arub01_49860 [Actinomadura rubrobrunea]|jgi:anti-sigma B factor antagonist|uniref:Anti-sigma factor antagonist n=1 Tax=Actinomadura rubrobrunea TaxID=115335 RepID=A0A9W6PZG3_9ACTN|nr:STAS domain-containing protein [Actinomadura rubrobrunea]GLW66742.1 hypothetical protein Arub01_49860 [Actinomadura rubrobrunea]